MSTYVMSDIHGCYDELMKMMEKIEFSKDDKLIIAGDYMDRGFQSVELLDWVCSAPENVILLKGNHDVEFVKYVEIMSVLGKKLLDDFSEDSLEDTLITLDVDCGAVFRKRLGKGNMACLRLEDEKEFYLW